MANQDVVDTQQNSTKLFKSYLTGLICSVILVFISYYLVITKMLSTCQLYTGLAILLVLQVLVQVVYYFRLNSKTEDSRWNLIVFLFTLLIMLIVISGSLWIMYNLNYYMVHTQ